MKYMFMFMAALANASLDADEASTSPLMDSIIEHSAIICSVTIMSGSEVLQNMTSSEGTYSAKVVTVFKGDIAVGANIIISRSLPIVAGSAATKDHKQPRMRIEDASIVFLSPKAEAGNYPQPHYALVDQWLGILPAAPNLEQYVKGKMTAAGK